MAKKWLWILFVGLVIIAVPTGIIYRHISKKFDPSDCIEMMRVNPDTMVASKMLIYPGEWKRLDRVHPNGLKERMILSLHSQTFGDHEVNQLIQFHEDGWVQYGGYKCDLPVELVEKKEIGEFLRVYHSKWKKPFMTQDELSEYVRNNVLATQLWLEQQQGKETEPEVGENLSKWNTKLKG